MSIIKKQVLLLRFDHPNFVCENYTSMISSVFIGYNYDVKIISISKNLTEQFSLVDKRKVEFIFSLTSFPLVIKINEIPIYNFFDCPFFLYIIDTPIYELAYPMVLAYFKQSLFDERLHIAFAEKSYANLYSKLINSSLNKSNIHFVPFAAFPSPKKNDKTRVDRLAVIGGIDTELKAINGIKKHTNRNNKNK